MVVIMDTPAPIMGMTAAPITGMADIIPPGGLATTTGLIPIMAIIPITHTVTGPAATTTAGEGAVIGTGTMAAAGMTIGETIREAAAANGRAVTEGMEDGIHPHAEDGREMPAAARVGEARQALNGAAVAFGQVREAEGVEGAVLAEAEAVPAAANPGKSTLFIRSCGKPTKTGFNAGEVNSDVIRQIDNRGDGSTPVFGLRGFAGSRTRRLLARVGPPRVYSVFWLPSLYPALFLSPLLLSSASLSGAAITSSLYRTRRKSCERTAELVLLPERGQLLSARRGMSGRLADRQALS